MKNNCLRFFLDHLEMVRDMSTWRKNLFRGKRIKSLERKNMMDI